MIKAKDEVEEVLGQPDIPLSAAQRLTERRTLLALGVAECAFRSRRRPGGVGRDPPPDCGVLWKMAQLGKRARATPPARLRGGLRPSTTSAHGPRDVSGASRGCPWAACRAISTGASIPFASTRQVTDGPKLPHSQRLMTWRGDRSPDARTRPSAWG